MKTWLYDGLLSAGSILLADALLAAGGLVIEARSAHVAQRLAAVPVRPPRVVRRTPPPRVG